MTRPSNVTRPFPPGLPPGLEATALRQHHIVSRAQLLAAGISDMQMYRQVRRGAWLRVLPATYALVNGALTDEQRRTSAALYVGRGGQLTGLAALDWYGFRYCPPDTRVQFVVPHHLTRRSVGHAVVTRALALDERARDAGLYPVCSPARAVVDAARELRNLRQVRAVVAEAVQRGFASLGGLDEEVRRARRSRTALVRRAVEEVTAGSRSAPEVELRECLAGSRVLPEILWNPTLRRVDGTVLPTPDGYLTDGAIALEVDSQEFHFSPGDWSRTLDRHNELTRNGIMVLHFTPAQVRRDPGRVRRTVEDAYRTRQGTKAATAVLAGAPSYTGSDNKGPLLTPQQPGRRSIR